MPGSLVSRNLIEYEGHFDKQYFYALYVNLGNGWVRGSDSVTLAGVARQGREHLKIRSAGIEANTK